MGTFLTSSILWDKPSKETCWLKKRFHCWDIWSICTVTCLTWASSLSDPSSFKLSANKYRSIWKCKNDDHPPSTNGYWGDVSRWQFWAFKLLSSKAEDPGTILLPCWVYLPFAHLALVMRTSINCLDDFKQILLNLPIWMWRAGEPHSMLQLGTMPAAPSHQMGSF